MGGKEKKQRDLFITIKATIMRLFKKFSSFNLSHYILVSITFRGWCYLEENERENLITAIMNSKVIVDGKAYYKLQAGLVMQIFGAQSSGSHQLIETNILIPKGTQSELKIYRRKVRNQKLKVIATWVGIYVVSVVVLYYLISKYTGL